MPSVLGTFTAHLERRVLELYLAMIRGRQITPSLHSPSLTRSLSDKGRGLGGSRTKKARQESQEQLRGFGRGAGPFLSRRGLIPCLAEKGVSRSPRR